jgi:predicted dehydrogenase
MTRPIIGVGVVGTAWITRAHAHALRTINHIAPLSHEIRLVNVYGRRAEAAERLRDDFGFTRSTTDWESLVADPEVDVIANLATNVLHEPVSVAALEAGKPVLCEKPLATDSAAARRMLDAAVRGEVPNACGFSYRFIPAMALFHDLVSSGRLGDIHHFRGLFLQDGVRRPEGAETSGSGSVLDFCHILDMLRHLSGEPRAVTAMTANFGGDGDDFFGAVVKLDGQGLGTLEGSRYATGWKMRQRIEVSGSEGGAWWDMEDMNRLHVSFTSDAASGLGGFRDVLVTEPDHPFMNYWWPPGATLGWEHTFMHQWRVFLSEVLGGERSPLLARFLDGVRAAELAEAIYASNDTGRQVDLVASRPAGPVR